MCLTGLLSKEYSRPSERARKLGVYLRYCSLGLLFVAMLRLLSFSLWAWMCDMLTAVYGLALYRNSFADRERNVVAMESVLCFALVIFTDFIIGVLTIVGLAYRNSFVSGVSLAGWQIICGFVVSGVAVVVYLTTLIVLYLLRQELSETTLIAPDEASSLRRNPVDAESFVPIGRSATSFGNSNNFNRQQSANGNGTSTYTDAERFPGTGYKLAL